QESPRYDVEELVLIVVFLPVILALHDTQAHDRLVHPAERLVAPRVRAGRDQRRHVHHLERAEADVEMRVVRVGGRRFGPGELRARARRLRATPGPRSLAGHARAHALFALSCAIARRTMSSASSTSAAVTSSGGRKRRLFSPHGRMTMPRS